MSLTNNADFKRVTRQIQARFPGWKIEKIMLQDTNRTILRVRKGDQAAQVHMVSFAGDSAGKSRAARRQAKADMRSYATWVRMLCSLQDADCLALPVQCALTPPSILRGGARKVLVLQPELTPLSRAQHQPLDEAVIAGAFRAVCRALHRCREDRLPHGALVAQNLLQRPDGSCCLGGMLDPQCLDDCEQLIPPESAELQRAAVLMKELRGDKAQPEEYDQGSQALCRLLDRASVGEKGLSLKKVIQELEGIQPLLKPAAEQSAARSGYRDVTDLFSTLGKHAMKAQDPDRTVGVRAGRQAARPSDPDRTVGVRNASAGSLQSTPQRQEQPSPHGAAPAPMPDDPDETVCMKQ